MMLTFLRSFSTNVWRCFVVYPSVEEPKPRAKPSSIQSSFFGLSACSSLAFTSPMATQVDRLMSSRQLSNNSLVHCLLKLAQKESVHTPLIFAVLSTLSLSQECRGIMCKVLAPFSDEFRSSYWWHFVSLEKRSSAKHSFSWFHFRVISLTNFLECQNWTARRAKRRKPTSLCGWICWSIYPSLLTDRTWSWRPRVCV